MRLANAWMNEITKTIVPAARTGKIGDGKIYVHDAGTAVQIRNEDRGELAR